MISCNNIYKKYPFDEVLINFSYTFPDTGFILLYGESGCGKTTLLNIIAGVTDFDKGEVVFNTKTYHNKVISDKVSSYIGYITQDPHFVDYLTVLDNLRLCSIDDERIESILSDFGLEDRRNNYPGTLSGGEKQRAAIIQALLQDKEILLLDEPTASLDRDNKINILETIKGLKESKLIICCSHDEEAKAYADDIIDFNNLKNNQQSLKISSTCDNNKIINMQEKRKIQPFMSKLYSYPRREKKSKILLSIVFMLSFLALCICDTPENKVESNIKYTYHLNQIEAYCDDINKPLLDEVKKNKNIMEINLMYGCSVPNGLEKGQDQNIEYTATYNMTAETIPFNKDAFYLSDCIEYGSYYTKAEQVILSYAMAESMGNPEELIGETMKVEMYDKSYDFEIVGIFRKFNEFEKQYLWASGIFWTEGCEHEVFYINGEFTKRYIYNKDFNDRAYVLYFNTFNNMKSFYKYYKEKDTDIILCYGINSVKHIFLFEDMFIILVPIILMVIPIAILLYYQIRKTEMIYNRHIFSVYQYLGYTIKEIKKSWIISSLKEILKMISFSLAAAIPIMLIVNFINSKAVIIPFQIFTFNIYLILLMVLLVSVLSVLVSLNTIKKAGIEGWYKVLLEQRDLL